MPGLGERGSYYSQNGGQREPENLEPFFQIVLLALIIGAGFFLFGMWQDHQAASTATSRDITPFSPTPEVRVDYKPTAVPAAQQAVLSASFKNRSFSPETIVVDNATITLSRSVGFSGGKRIETLVFNNTGSSPASFRTLVMFPKSIAKTASDIEVAGAEPGEIYVLQADPSLFVDIKDLADGVWRTVTFSSDDDPGFPVDVGSIHFVLKSSAFPISPEDNERLKSLLNNPWLQAQSGSDAEETSKKLSEILNKEGDLGDAITEAEQLFSTTPNQGAQQEQALGQDATGETIAPPKPQRCSDAPITVSEFMPGFYCEEPVPNEFLNPEMHFDYSLAGLDEFAPGLAVNYTNGTVAVFVDYRQLIRGGRLPFARGFASGLVEYGDLTKPRNPDGSLRKFNFTLSILYKNNFNDYVKIWPPTLNFKEYAGKAVEKAVLVSNNLPYDLEGYDFVVCGRQMNLKAREVGAFTATINDQGCQVTQRGEGVENGFAINVSHVDFLPKEEAEKFVSEDYLEPRLASYEGDCSNQYCNCEETAAFASLFVSQFQDSLQLDAFSFKKLFGKNDYSATQIFLSANSKDGSVCPLPKELQSLGLWPARLNLAKLSAGLREAGEKTQLDNNGFWTGNWAITASRGGVQPGQWGDASDLGRFTALYDLTKQPFIYYATDSDNRLFKSDEYSYYTIGQR